MTRPTDDRGSTSVFVVMLVLPLLALAALAYDGGRILATRREAAGLAAGAARSGAQAIEVLDDGIEVVPDEAASRVDDFLAATPGAAHSVVVGGSDVTVTVSISQPTFLLGLFGVHSRTVTATRTARGVERT